MYDYQRIIDKYYPAGSPLRDIYMRHCRSVANLALDIARRKGLDLSPADIEAAAMLHDIGIVRTDAPGIHCHGSEPYLAHGRIGADLLRAEGAPEEYARVAERHTGAGLTPEDVARMSPMLPPDRSYMPQTLLERLVCYADKFYSKSHPDEERSPEQVCRSLRKFGEEGVDIFRAWHHRFG